jgi:hypothetical protein
MGGLDRCRDRDRWWAVVNAVMNRRVPYNAKDFLTGLRTCWLLRKDSAPRIKYVNICFLSLKMFGPVRFRGSQGKYCEQQPSGM